MAETIRCVLLIALMIAFFGSADETADSVPAAITVYRNPEFFRNLTDRREDLEREEEEVEEDKGEAYNNNSEEFYDFDDEYKYPGEPKKPNPPASPDFTTYFDESPEFQPEPREISPPSGGIREEEHYEDAEGENELNEDDHYGHLRSTTPSYYHHANRESPDGESSDEENEDRESTELRGDREYGYGENQDEEDSEDEREANEEDDSEHSSEDADDEPGKKDHRYNVQMDKNLKTRVPAKVYEESREYFNPVLNSGITAFHYPSAYEDLNDYSYEDDDNKKVVVDNKKGTREYLKDHSIEEVEDPRNPGNIRAGSKHIFRTVSKIGIKAFKPVLYIPHVHRVKKKYRVLHKPKFYKWHHFREVPDDSAYQLSSDYDSEFEFF